MTIGLIIAGIVALLWLGLSIVAAILTHGVTDNGPWRFLKFVFLFFTMPVWWPVKKLLRN